MASAHGQPENFVNADLCKYIELLLFQQKRSLDDRQSIVFEQHLTLAPASKEVEEVTKEDDRIHITSNILNIIGLYGPMPDSYNESFLAQVRKQKSLS